MDGLCEYKYSDFPLFLDDSPSLGPRRNNNVKCQELPITEHYPSSFYTQLTILSSVSGGLVLCPN